MRIFRADFETTTEETCANETWVWAYGIRELFKENSFKLVLFSSILVVSGYCIVYHVK